MSALSELKKISWYKQSFLETCIINAEDEESAEELEEIKRESDGRKDIIHNIVRENATMRAKLNEAIAWHEGDDSPHAQLEAELATLRDAHNEMEGIIGELKFNDAGLRAKLTTLRALLKESEWAAHDTDRSDWITDRSDWISEGIYCWSCTRLRDEGHAPDCKLAAALRELIPQDVTPK
jgi:chromosome segregation ATPase